MVAGNNYMIYHAILLRPAGKIFFLLLFTGCICAFLEINYLEYHQPAVHTIAAQDSVPNNTVMMGRGQMVGKLLTHEEGITMWETFQLFNADTSIL